MDDLEAYLNARVLSEGIKAAQAVGAINRASIKLGLEALGDFRIGELYLNFSPTNHNASRYAEIIMATTEQRFIR